MNEFERLAQAIEHLESQRSTLGDEVIEAALLPLQEKMAELEVQADFPKLQRKQVAILFTDFVESIKVASLFDPENTRDIFDNVWPNLLSSTMGMSPSPSWMASRLFLVRHKVYEKSNDTKHSRRI